MLVASLSPRGQPIARDPSRHPPRRVPSWAQAPGGETKGAEIFHQVDEEHVTCWLHHCPPGGGGGWAYSPRPMSAPP